MKIILSIFLILFVSQIRAEEDKDTEKIVQEREAFAKSAPAQTGIKIDENLVKLQALAQSAPNVGALLAPESRLKLVEIFKTNPFRSFPPFLVRKHFLDVTRGKKLGEIFEQHPDVLNALVAIVLDEKALPGLIQLLGQDEKLKIYGIIAIVGLILSWILGKYWVPKGIGFVYSFLLKTLISLGISFITLGIFCFMFRNELSPTFEIIWRYSF